MDNYFEYTLHPESDLAKLTLGLPLPIPIFKLCYTVRGERHTVSVYPTVQFLYSHHLRAEYITPEVRDIIGRRDEPSAFCRRFLDAARQQREADAHAAHCAQRPTDGVDIEVLIDAVRQSPQYSLAAIEPGVYVLGMKDQFNAFDLPSHPLAEHVR